MKRSTSLLIRKFLILAYNAAYHDSDDHNSHDYRSDGYFEAQHPASSQN
jgi:hypothetical protein